jgi:aminopeptidase-like protein
MKTHKWTSVAADISADEIGESCYSLIKRLYPLCRSITGEGTRETLEILGEHIDLDIKSIATGTSVFDWTVPKEWNIRKACIETLSGEKIVDFENSNLHVVSYSVPVDEVITLDELQQHLHSIPEHPDWIPYRTAYYNETWGFCVSENQRQSLRDEHYKVHIDSELKPGHLRYGEYFLGGDSEEEFLIFTHICHPSLCNDNLSGISIATQLATLLREQPSLNRSYRFVFAPATIGSIAWLHHNQDKFPNIKAGLVLAVAGDPGPMTYKLNRNKNCYIDKMVEHVLSSRDSPYNIVEFSPYGYDERQFCSPGINLPVGSLTRTPNGCYPEYHTSADNLDLVQPEYLADSLSAYLDVINIFENDRKFINLQPYGEPQLGKRGLYRKTGGQQDIERSILAKLWVLNQSDGDHSLLEIAERANMSFNEIRAAAEELLNADLLDPLA